GCQTASSYPSPFFYPTEGRLIIKSWLAQGERRGRLRAPRANRAGTNQKPMQADEYLKLVEVEDRLWYFRSLHAHVRRELSRLPAAMPLRVLDAGCGTGGLIARLGPEQPAWRWTGIDFMPMACEWARRRCPGSEIRQASITD